jgi:thioredoxin reductase
MSDTVDVDIVGAGPAGVAMAVSLPTAAFDRLKLNTGKRFSRLPSRPYPAHARLFEP